MYVLLMRGQVSQCVFSSPVKGLESAVVCLVLNN